MRLQLEGLESAPIRQKKKNPAQGSTVTKIALDTGLFLGAIPWLWGCLFTGTRGWPRAPPRPSRGPGLTTPGPPGRMGLAVQKQAIGAAAESHSRANCSRPGVASRGRARAAAWRSIAEKQAKLPLFRFA